MDNTEGCGRFERLSGQQMPNRIDGRFPQDLAVKSTPHSIELGLAGCRLGIETTRCERPPSCRAQRELIFDF